MHATQYLAGRGIHADSVVGMGNPGSEIAELAEQRGADLIVVGTREPESLPPARAQRERRGRTQGPLRVLVVH